jgi:hypothetical protein
MIELKTILTMLKKGLKIIVLKKGYAYKKTSP